MNEIRIDRLRFRTSFLRYDEIEPANPDHNTDRTRPVEVDDWLDVEEGHHILIDDVRFLVLAIHLAATEPPSPDHRKIASGRAWMEESNPQPPP